MDKKIVLAFFWLVAFGCTSSPHQNVVCPDGTFISAGSACPKFEVKELNLRPEEFPSSTLNESKVTYVQKDGQLNGTVKLDSGETAQLSISTASPDFKKIYYFGFYTINPSRNSSLTLTNLSDGYFLFNFTAPRVQGNYYFVLVGIDKEDHSRVIGRYNVTVLGDVSNSSSAVAIADAYTYSMTMINTSGVDNWRVLSANATPADDSVDVDIQAQYDVCGIDFDQGKCEKGNIVSGNFIISRKTGQIIG